MIVSFPTIDRSGLHASVQSVLDKALGDVEAFSDLDNLAPRLLYCVVPNLNQVLLGIYGYLSPDEAVREA